MMRKSCRGEKGLQTILNMSGFSTSNCRAVRKKGSSTRAISHQYLLSFKIYVTFGRALHRRTSSYGRSDVARVMPPPISQKRAQNKGGQKAVRCTPTLRDTSPMNEAVAEMQIFPPPTQHFPRFSPPSRTPFQRKHGPNNPPSSSLTPYTNDRDPEERTKPS